MDHTGSGVQIESRELSAIPFVEKIDFEELQFDQTILGRGAFGTVSRARWRGIQVAVKLISTETEKKAFITELKQLSRVSHPNIVTLYGACLKPTVCLVMEYAEGGSLYNVLHGPDQPGYTVAHAISWCLQCAEGVDYLHNMKPKPLIHRDLKPPNLLLVNGGTTLKICDFGTACDKHTHMTNNKGSAAWMAPEVFEGVDYSEKCDVFSWGIILWETLTRHKPFETVDGPAFAIMWAVHQGQRPQPVSNCPKPIQSLMTKCWSKFPMERPAMGEIVRIMQKIMSFFKGADIPLVYPYVSGKFCQGMQPVSQSGVSQVSQGTWGRPSSDSNRASTVLPSGELNKQQGYPAATQDEAAKWAGKSAPPSLANSRESLDRSNSRSNTPSYDMFGANKRYSADMSKLEHLEFMKNQSNAPSQPARGHRRTGSHDSSSIVPEQQDRRDGSGGPVSMPPIHHSITAPGNLGANQPGVVLPQDSLYGYKMTAADAEFQLTIMAGEQQAEPIQPCFHSRESIRIWEEHLEVAKQYQKIQTDIAVLTRRKLELHDSLKQEDVLIEGKKKKVPTATLR